ncbi:MAG: cytochrome c [Polyangiaceae bacterium]
MTGAVGRARAALITLLYLSAGALLGCEGGTPLERGTRTFQRSCAPCHGADGRKGSATVLGFNPPPRDLTDHEFHAQRSDEQLRRSIRLGKGQMPAFAAILDDDDIGSVILFIRTLDPGAAGAGGAGAAPSASAAPSLGASGAPSAAVQGEPTR